MAQTKRTKRNRDWITHRWRRFTGSRSASTRSSSNRVLYRQLEMAEHLPEDIIRRILERLPIKSLICFSCVSKHWRFIILSDSHFARAQFQIAFEHQTLTRRLLVISSKFESTPEIESLDLKAGDKRKLCCPFITAPSCVRILCSFNGLTCLFLQSESDGNSMYIWNPSTGFFRKLPKPGFLDKYGPACYGFGYSSATDDYKFVCKCSTIKIQAGIFSLRANVQKKIEFPSELEDDGNGILLNETLHWFNIDNAHDVFAFDLATEKFRRMPLPIINNDEIVTALGASLGGCLCMFAMKRNDIVCFSDMWVMREYGVDHSWTKLYTLKIAPHPEDFIFFQPILIMESSTLLKTVSVDDYDYDNMDDFFSKEWFRLIKSGHEEEELEICMFRVDPFGVVEYQETLHSAKSG